MVNVKFSDPTALNLYRLILLRSVVITTLFITLITLVNMHIPLPVMPIVMGIFALIILNLIASVNLNIKNEVQPKTLLIQLIGDILVLSFIFYFSGGYSNPLIWMYLLPITVAAVALKAKYAWLVALMSILAYTTLMFYFKPLSHLHLNAYGNPSLDIHLVGMWLGFVVSAILVAIVISRIGQNLRDYDQEIANSREQIIQSEKMMALGTLATSAAHALGTPLTTMAIISKDLEHELKGQPDIVKQLVTLRTQVSRCKEILSSMTKNANQSRLESLEGIDLKQFIDRLVSVWKDAHPATTLVSNIADDMPDQIITSDITLKQSIHNLLDNAADASPERVDLYANWDNKTLTFKIRDYGEGIPPNSKKQLGSPFFSSKGHQDGMGLGIYLTQTVLSKYNGSMTFNSPNDGGTEIIIDIPLDSMRLAS
jgi:two-component system sensor histidine kinase RegB